MRKFLLINDKSSGVSVLVPVDSIDYVVETETKTAVVAWVERAGQPNLNRTETKDTFLSICRRLEISF